MEQMRLLLAIVLTVMVFLLWEVLVTPEKPVQPPQEQKQTETQKQPSRQKEASETTQRTGAGRSGKKAEKPVEVPAKTFKSITVETDLYRAEITEKGAAIRQFVLKDYRSESDSDASLKKLVSGANPVGTALVRFSDQSYPDISNAVFTTDFDQSRLEVGKDARSISFFLETDQGVVLEKRYVFHPGSYGIDLTVNIVNQSDSPVPAGLSLDMTNPPPEGGRFVFQGPFAYINEDLEEIDVDDIEDQSLYSGLVKWAGIEDRYFMTALVPVNPDQTQLQLALEEMPEKLLRVTYLQPGNSLASGQRKQYEYKLFMGPKRMSELSAFGHELNEAINFGFFDIIAKPCLWAMNVIHDNVASNYGIAIILLTIVFKIIFWPLGSKSYRSMAEMKKLQPMMADIRKKYKDDKKKMNEEVMRLYKTYKVNPMSGCLPMVVQIPVFIAFYRMLYEAIELRHAPFMLWINDLSAPDRLFRFDFAIPFMTPPYGIPVLTLVMGATMFLQQKLSPPPGDPSQAKFMMFMPLIFTVIFINFPAGLVLYWLTNNVISVAQQYYITKKTV